MPSLVRGHNWATTALGPFEAWPQSLRAVVDLVLASPLPMVILWGPSLIQVYNNGYAVITEGRHPMALGQPTREIWPEVWESDEPIYADVLRGEARSFKDQKFTILRHDVAGDAWFDVTYSPLTNDAGKIEGVLVTMVETAVQAHQAGLLSAENEIAHNANLTLATDALHASEAFNHSILANSSDCVKVLALDATIMFMSEGGCRVMEIEDFTAVAGCLWPDIWEGASRIDAEAAVAAARAGGIGRFQGFAPTAKGIVRWWDVVVTPILGSDGKAETLLSISRDITPLHQAQQALAESEAKFRTMTNAMPQMVWSALPNGHHDYYNRRWYEYTGIRPGETESQGWHALVHPDDLAEALAGWRHSLDSGDPFEVEYRLRCADGTWRWCLVRALVVRGADAGEAVGGIDRWFGTCTEIQDLINARQIAARGEDELKRHVDERTAALVKALSALHKEVEERKQAEAALRQSQKMEAIGQLTGGIAHDFNNLLQGISGNLEMVQSRIAQGRTTEIERFASNAKAGLQRAGALTHRLLAFSRKQTLDPRRVDTNQLVAGMEDLLRNTVGPGIEVAVILSDALWPTLCDAHQMEGALLNLTINARDAMPNGGIITIETANFLIDDAYALVLGDAIEPGQYVSVSITDTGAGMSAEVVQKAFEPFFTTKPIGQGTGLGLSMLYGFTKQSKGHARIHSEVGRGTTVHIYLPHDRSDRVDPSPVSPLVEHAVRSDTGKTVLIVEDEPTVRLLLAETLLDLGYRVLQAPDGLSGLQALTLAGPIDLLVTDVGLPGMNGKQLAEHARKHRPHLKVLFITGYVHSAAVGRGEALEPGMALLSKPFELATFTTKIEAMIDLEF